VKRLLSLFVLPFAIGLAVSTSGSTTAEAAVASSYECFKAFAQCKLGCIQSGQGNACVSDCLNQYFACTAAG
jgi:hypothetical protein